MKKYSKQRDAVYAMVCGTVLHPTAATVFSEVSEQIPNISLATVYRNLSDLCDDGKLIRIISDDGVTHYDANVERHHHLTCSECGTVVDVPIQLNIDISSVKDCKINDYGVMFYGKCPNCSKK